MSIASLFTEAAVNRAAHDLILLSNDSDFGPIFSLAKKYACSPVLAFVLGPADWSAPILGTTLYERVIPESPPRHVRSAAVAEASAASRSGGRGPHVAANAAGVW